MLWSTSPACTELETHVLDWLREALDLPDRFASSGDGGGVLQDSASSATLCALLAARQRAADDPADVSRCTVYASEHAHSSVPKAVRIAGLDPANLREITTDEQFAMRPDALAGALVDDRRRGLIPTMVVATTGSTSSLAFDPIRPIGEAAAAAGCWLHVDAAMAGTAAVCPEFRWFHDGVELADSYCFNPHKWMFTNFDCDAFWVADRAALLDALSITPEYLRNAASSSGAVIDYRDWQVPLGRRFRALKLWFVLRHYGIEGLRHHVREHVRIAGRLAERVAAHPDLELVAPTALNLVCLRHRAGDQATAALLERINDTGTALLTHTRLAGRYTIRCAIGQTRTTQDHADRLWRLIERLCATTDAGTAAAT
jgi:aromatic-L-amino-acid decarboxylase